MAQISVIVPLYNTEKLLPRCVDSILGQTFRDLELILVNDGSTDRSGEICDAYAAKDSRIHVIHKSNSGVGATRNVGLEWVMENSDSQWISFVDSDDWIHPEMLQRLLDTARKYHSKLSVCGYLETADGELTVTEEQFRAKLWKPADFYQSQEILATVPWAKLYAKEFFRDLRYPVGTYLDDEFVTYKILFQLEEIPVMPAGMYGYYINPQGITRKPWVPKRLDIWQAYDQQLAFFKTLGDPELIRFRVNGYLDNAKANLQYLEESENAGEMEEYRSIIEKKIHDLIPIALKYKVIAYRYDFDLIHKYYPLRSKMVRLCREILWKLGVREDG